MDSGRTPPDSRRSTRFDNISADTGSGLFLSSSSPLITDCVFTMNYGYCGAGIANKGGSPTLVRCMISNNRAGKRVCQGGGMYNTSGAPTLIDCTFSGNSVDPVYGSDLNDSIGGGLFTANSNVTLLHCTFRGNYAGYRGGGLGNSLGKIFLSDCVFEDNSSGGFGGGLFTSSASATSPTYVNCVFRGNRAHYSGGGMYNYGSPSIVNCTFGSNSSSDGGGFYSAGGSPKLTNSILWSNAGSTNPQIFGSATVSHCCIQGGWPGNGNIDDDPRFASLAAGDMRLTSGSPCIDAGNNAAVPSNTLTDVSGFSRFFDNPNTADCQWFPGSCGTAPIVDMGAYEANSTPPPCITLQPIGQTVCEGTTIALEVSADGAGTLFYRWQKNGVNLSDNGHYTGATAGILTVNFAVPADNGDYQCLVTDDNGNTLSSEAKLIVKPATVIKQQPVDASSTPATFTVAASGDGELYYQWQRNGINLTDGVHLTGTSTPILTVPYCACGYPGIYRCVVTGNCGTVSSNHVTLMCQPGDFDQDTDVDQEDFGRLQLCLKQDVLIDTSCTSMDLDGDGFVDQSDISKFIQCLTGPQVPGDPNCGE